jgi:hypothetical protein
MMKNHHPLPSLPRLALLAAALLLMVAVLPGPALAVDNPKPVIKYLSPTVVSAGAKAPLLYIIGTGFGQDSVVQWDGVDRETEYYSSTKISVRLTNDDVAYPATVTVTVFNPAPGGGLSNAKSFMVKYVPIVKSLRPAVVELEPATLQPKDGKSYWEIVGSRLNPPMTTAFGRAIAVVCENNQPVIFVLLSDTSKLTSTTKSAVYRLTSTTQGQIGSFDRITPISGPATGLAARSTTEFFYSSGRTITRVIAGSPPSVTSTTLPVTIGGLDYYGGAEPFLLAISGAAGDHRVFSIPLDPVTGNFLGTWATYLQINVPPGSPLASSTYTGVSLVPAWGSSREPVLYVTKEDGTADPGDVAAIVDMRGTVLQTVVGDKNGILVDHTVWSSGLSSSYLNWANPQGIDYAEDCSACQCGPGRLFMITRDFWNKGPKYPIDPPDGCIKGMKWNDLDRDGFWDRDEPVVAGWPVSLYKEYCGQWYKAGEATTQTDGVYQFCDLYGSGNYRVIEGERPGWTRSWPESPGYHDFYYTKYTTVTGKDFGNYQSAPGKIIIRKAAEDCLTPPSGMVGWWAGDESAEDLVDTNDGTFPAGTYAAGKVDDAFSLDGLDDAVRITEAGTQLDGFSQLTLDAWVKPDTLYPGIPLGLQTIVAKYDYAQADGVSYWLGLLPDGKVRFAVYSGNTANSAYSGINVDTLENVVATDAMYHVAGLWDGVNTPIIYVNGVKKDTKTESGTSPMGAQVTSSTVPVTIGAVNGFSAANTPAFYFDGIIDEVEIFDRALSATEVKAIADAGSAGKCKSGSVTFPFTGTGGLGSFPLLLGGEKVFENLAAGTYAVTEQVPSGWSLKAIQCSDDTGGTTTTGPTAQISLAQGETVVCTFVNEKCSCNPCG